MIRRALSLVLFAILVPSLANAEALLRLTPTGWSPSAYEAAGYPLDPANVGPDGFRLTFHGGGNQTLTDPVLLIIGIPDATAAPDLITSLLSGGLTSVDVDRDGDLFFGGSWDANGLAGVFDSSAGSDSVYQFIGFDDPAGGGADSESYANWSGATGLTSWNIFVYALTFEPDFQRGDFVEFTTSLSLPGGSYVVGYGLEPDEQHGPNTVPGDVQATPFTFAGRVVEVPEPGTFSLLIPALGLFLARHRKNNPSL